MATTIVSPTTANTGFNSDQVDQLFSKNYSMLGPVSGGGAGPGGVSPQPISGDSLTQFWRGLSNYAGGQVPNFIQAGGGLLGTGTGLTRVGTDVSGEALNTLQDPMKFYQQLLSGNPTAVTAALAPTAANISAITSGALNQASQGLPAGGYRAATLAGLPFAQLGALTNAAYGLQRDAATGLERVSGEQEQIGQGIAQTGLGLGQLGTVLTGQGLQTLQNTIADVLSKMGINIQGGTANLFANIVGSL